MCVHVCTVYKHLFILRPQTRSIDLNCSCSSEFVQWRVMKNPDEGSWCILKTAAKQHESFVHSLCKSQRLIVLQKIQQLKWSKVLRCSTYLPTELSLFTLSNAESVSHQQAEVLQAMLQGRLLEPVKISTCNGRRFDKVQRRFPQTNEKTNLVEMTKNHTTSTLTHQNHMRLPTSSCGKANATACPCDLSIYVILQDFWSLKIKCWIEILQSFWVIWTDLDCRKETGLATQWRFLLCPDRNCRTHTRNRRNWNYKHKIAQILERISKLMQTSTIWQVLYWVARFGPCVRGPFCSYPPQHPQGQQVQKGPSFFKYPETAPYRFTRALPRFFMEK